MKPEYSCFTKVLAFALAVALTPVPAVLAQAQTAPPSPPQTTPAQTGGSTLDVDPSKGPLQPVPPRRDVPNAPSATEAAPEARRMAPQAERPNAPEPQGVAAAGGALTSGGPAAKPAGTALAPAKQRQTRSLLIKLGAIAAGGAAIGAIYGLSRSTSSTPSTSGARQVH